MNLKWRRQRLQILSIVFYHLYYKCLLSFVQNYCTRFLFVRAISLIGNELYREHRVIDCAQFIILSYDISFSFKFDTYTHTYLYTHTHIYIHIPTHTHIHTYTYTHTHTHTHIPIYIHICNLSTVILVTWSIWIWGLACMLYGRKMGTRPWQLGCWEFLSLFFFFSVLYIFYLLVIYKFVIA